ncbi:MAG TPA: sulfatase-like hydrolase/transferase [Gammaproteobacteria bacterium]
MRKIPPLLRFLATAVLFYVVLFSAARIAFWLYFDNPNDPLGSGDLLQALYIGLKFDLRIALLLVLPLFLVGWLRFLSPLYSRFGSWLWSGYLTLATVLLLLFYATDFGHFAYLATRIDISILRFLDNAAISFGMVWQTYPVITWGVAIALLTFIFFKGLARVQRRYAAISAPHYSWKGKLLIGTITFFTVVGGLYGKLSYYPLRWSDAFFSPNAFASSVTLNPVLYFYETVRNGGVEFDEQVVRDHYDLMADFLGVTARDAAKLNFRRDEQPTAQRATPPNVVMVFLESFASYKAGLSGNPLDPTPHVDALARDGLFYENFYVPQTGTARSVFTAITGIPDIQFNDTSTQNATIINQRLIINAFADHEKFYFLGGSASWRNIRGLLSNNIPNLHIYEEGSYASPRIDVWGISDLDLFKEANQVLREQQKPFFAIIQTSGNHRPYTIPADNHAFVVKTPGSDELAKYGFISVEEYNSFRFMDHSVGYFIEQAKKEGYFDNTIFAFFGDHGISGDPGIHARKMDGQLGLNSNRVPFIIYAPKLIEAQKSSTVASETDILPTLASLAGYRYTNTTFGRDLTDPRFVEPRRAFIVERSPIPFVGLIDNDYFFRWRIDGKEKHLHLINSEEPRQDVLAQHPDKAAELEQLTRAYFETAKYIINNNGRDSAPATTQETAQ